MFRPVLFSALILGFFSAGLVHAANVDGVCESSLLAPPRPITLSTLREYSKARNAANYAKVPAPKFDALEVQARIEQVGEIGPKALQDFLPEGIKFVSTPAPTSPDPMVIGLLEDAHSIATHVEVDHAGHRPSTAVYANLPIPKVLNAGDHIIGKEYKIVKVHLHGGGTPTATGLNGMGPAKELAKRGIPTLTLDLPGHGRATRNIRGFETMEGVMEYLLNLFDKTIAPNVMIDLSGHSWGAELAIYMHRHSDDPRLKRIVHYSALSPPVDVSMGQGGDIKYEFEDRYQQSFREFSHLIAPADLEFLNNMLVNGKDSDIGSYFTTLTNFDYSTPPYTDEEQARLKPLLVLVGDQDGLVYVGRSEEFTKVFGGLKGKNKYMLLGPGISWKSKNENDLQPTGHNVFDRHDENGALQTYKIMGDWTLQDIGQMSPAPREADRAEILMNRMFQNYANFIGFRELINGRIEYVHKETDQKLPMMHRQAALEQYIEKLDDLNEKVAQLSDTTNKVPPEVSAAVATLRTELGLHPQLSFGRAKEELAMPERTEAREKELNDFIAALDATDKNIREAYTDPVYERTINTLNTEFAQTLTATGLASVLDYAPKFKEYNAMKKPAAEADKIRGELSRLHQRMIETENKRRERFSAHREPLLARVPHPAGVTDFRSARRELDADRSPDFRRRLQEFVDRYPAIEAGVIAKLTEALRTQIAALALPEVVSSTEEARAELAKINDAFTRSAAPYAGNAAQDAKMTAELDRLRLKRLKLLKEWDRIWTAEVPVTSPALAKLNAAVEAKLVAYAEAYFKYHGAESDRLRELSESGRATAENIEAIPEANRKLRQAYFDARVAYFNIREKLEPLRLQEAFAGHLDSGDVSLRNRARQLATDLNTLLPDLRRTEDEINAMTAMHSVQNTLLAASRAEDTHAMRAAGEAVPFLITAVSIDGILDQSLTGALQRLRTDPLALAAVEQTLNTWETILARLRLEHSSGAASGY